MHRFYIGPRGLCCNLHRKIDSWFTVDIINSNHPFSCDQIEDMVDLLRFEPKSLNFDLSGNS